MDKILKLSDAILIGAAAHKKCCGQYCREKNGEIVATCAIGAAFVALGKDPRNEIMMDSISLSERFNIPDGTITEIVDKNDRLKWRRERIAKWLKTEGY